MRYILFAVLFASQAAVAANLAEMVEKKIEEKAAQDKAKEMGAAPLGVNSQAAIITSTPNKTRDDVTPDDLQVIGILGVGDNLKAKVIIKNSPPISMMVGQALQGGWTLAHMTPNVVTFEKYGTSKNKKNKKPERTVMARRQIMISGNNQFRRPEDMATAAPSKLGTPPNLVNVPALQ